MVLQALTAMVSCRFSQLWSPAGSRGRGLLQARVAMVSCRLAWPWSPAGSRGRGPSCRLTWPWSPAWSPAGSHDRGLLHGLLQARQLLTTFLADRFLLSLTSFSALLTAAET